MTTRLAVEQDYERLRQFDEWDEAAPERIRAGECIVAERDDEISAYAIVDRSFFGRPFIAFVFVDPKSRRNGLCSELLRHAEADCPGPKLWVSTSAENEVMQGALAKREYRQSGVVHDLGEVPELIYHKRIGNQ